MFQRVMIGLLAVAVIAIAVVAVTTDRPDGPSQQEMARSLGTDVMRHIVRGHVEGRSGEIYLVPQPNYYMVPSSYADLTRLGTNDPVLISSHPNPWAYLARVPIIVRGEDWSQPGVTNYDEVDIADLPASYAELLGIETEEELEGEPLPGFDTSGPAPKVVFTVVIDGGGWNVLQEHPDSHPFIDRLMAEGTTYVNATIGSAPSITGALHATFGTGVYPNRHGLPGNQMRGPDGKNTDAWQENADPTYLEAPTVSELWDEQNDNRPVVATVSYEGWHLGMIGHGAQRTGGDKDIAALWHQDDASWFINEDYYALPSSLRTTDIDRLESYEEVLDPRDGIADGAWFGNELEHLREPHVRPGTPAFVRFTGDAVVDMLREEGIGTDDVTDFVWIEMKMPDFAGHAWSMNSSEEADVLRETDRQMARFDAELRRLVGRDGYTYAVSADHGQQPIADLVGGWRIHQEEMERDIEAEFGDVLEKSTPVDLYVSAEGLEEEGVTMDDIARFLGTYTIEDNIPDDAEGADRVPEALLDERIFVGAFTTDYLLGLSPEDLDSLGLGDHPEGDFVIEPPEGGG